MSKTSKAPPPGSQWRTLAWTEKSRPVATKSKDYDRFGTIGEYQEHQECRLTMRTVLDEVVISPWLHIEQMGTRSWFVKVAGRCLWVSVDKHGKARITGEETRD